MKKIAMFSVSLFIVALFGITTVISDENQPPVALFDHWFLFGTGMRVEFDASGSYDPDGEIVLYKWDFGDGSAPVYGLAVAHDYEIEQNYTVNLTVKDNGLATNSYPQVIECCGGGHG